MKNNNRISNAHKIINKANLILLGQGHEGIVFHDNNYVYKVYDNIYSKNSVIDKYSELLLLKKISKDAKHIYYAEPEIIEDVILLKYKYENGSECIIYNEEDAISVLTEQWINKIIFKDCKPDNFIYVNDILKIIDLECCQYNDNLFLNLCCRYFIYINYYGKIDKCSFEKLKRSSINNFELDELKGLNEFINKVFLNIIKEESKPKSLNIPKSANTNNELNITDNYIKASVTLLIKTCAQDIDTIEENIKHIIKQLSSPNIFHEKVVLIDCREADFLRQFNNSSNKEELIEVIEKLKDQSIIDRYIIFNNQLSKDINKRWFNIESQSSHTASKIPLASQLYAFENCKGEYILQMDSDVLIGRTDLSHSFIDDMIRTLRENEKCVSVGFNIPNKETNTYFGFEDGGFVPEVRFCLLDKQRLFSLLPLYNEIDKNGIPVYSWYRSLHLKQKETGYYSLRGGDKRSFYIHPQNYRKKSIYSWISMMDRIEQGYIPEIQYGKFDLEGSYYDWCIPKRSEKLIVISCFRNLSKEIFLRMWNSLINQSLEDFGIILIDDFSDNELPEFIFSIIEEYKERITFLSNKFKSAKLENIYRVINNYISNDDSIIVMLDGDDALIGKNVLKDIYERYERFNNDVVIGRVHQSYRIQSHYRYPANFINPNKRGGNVWQHIKSFRKYLFTSIPLHYLKYNELGNISNLKWYDDLDDYAFMIPIINMSSNPFQMDNINYYYDKNIEITPKNKAKEELIIADILSKPALSPKSVFKNRKRFRPCHSKIEIDITYECNLNCYSCNRSCSQAPSKEHMSIDQISTFIEQSINSNVKWEFINILGGEPTLHPNFLEIVELLIKEYINKHSENTILRIVSNGIDEESRNKCNYISDKYKSVIIDINSYKEHKHNEYFTAFNDAPVDNEKFKDVDFTDACWVTSHCGIGLNNKGYYVCAVAAGIDRVIKEGLYKSHFNMLDEDNCREQYNKFCRLCGNFKDYHNNKGEFLPRTEKRNFNNTISSTWVDIYKNYNSNK